eukprot:7134516-Pyramimonas_sp.AAC.1
MPERERIAAMGIAAKELSGHVDEDQRMPLWIVAAKADASIEVGLGLAFGHSGQGEGGLAM